jgi:hypothetical protein
MVHWWPVSSASSVVCTQLLHQHCFSSSNLEDLVNPVLESDTISLGSEIRS